MHVFIIVHT